jgi:hypothetical protein
LACFPQKGKAKLEANEMANVKENKDRPGKVSTCFDDSTSAEMMEKLLAVEGVGSLCDETTRSLVKKCCEGQGEPQAAQKKEDIGPIDPSKGERK